MTGLAERLKPPALVSFPGSHLGLRWRSLIPSDLGAVAELIRQVEKEDDAIFRTSSKEIADLALGQCGAAPLEVIVGIAQDQGIVALGSVKILASLTEAAVAIVNAVLAVLCFTGRTGVHAKCSLSISVPTVNSQPLLLTGLTVI